MSETLNYVVGFAVVIVLWGCLGYILWRYPDFRRAFIEHWRPSAVAARMDAFAKRLEERNRR